MPNALETASSFSALKAAWEQKKSRLVGSCFGVDRISGRTFQRQWQSNLAQISRAMEAGFAPHGLLAIPKPKDGGGHRIICVPTVADRLVQFSILDRLKPRLRRSGLDNPVSYGLAAGRSRSLIGARNFACKERAKHPWVYKTDIHKFFDRLDRGLLKQAVRRVVAQRSLHDVLFRFVDSEITDGIEPGWRKVVSDAGIAPGVGVRQGMPLSPFFAGAYLRDLDRWLMRLGLSAARYVDDIVVFFDDEESARAFHPALKARLQRIGLSIGELGASGSKTKLYSPTDPADFLGMEITLIDGRYCLHVSQGTKDRIGEKFAKLSNVSGLAEQGVQLTTMGTYLRAMNCGYRNAYDVANNFNDFATYLDGLCEGTKLTVLTELFGDKLVDMSPTELRFVGVE